MAGDGVGMGWDVMRWHGMSWDGMVHPSCAHVCAHVRFCVPPDRNTCAAAVAVLLLSLGWPKWPMHQLQTQLSAQMQRLGFTEVLEGFATSRQYSSGPQNQCDL